MTYDGGSEGRWDTAEKVTKHLEYYSDLQFGPAEPCFALRPIGIAPSSQFQFQTRGMRLREDPVWDFDPRFDFQPTFPADEWKMKWGGALGRGMGE